jgi:hypothetical protein
MFSGGAGDIFGLGSGRPDLGRERSPQNWYDYGRSEVAQYDSYLIRARKIANKSVREQVVKDYHGDPGDSESAIYRRNSVEGNIRQAESYTPVNYYIFSASQVQSRVEKLNDWNKGFGDAVKAAEATYGSLPEPQVIETVKMVETSATPGWVTPVVIGAVAIAALGVFGAFGGK